MNVNIVGKKNQFARCLNYFFLTTTIGMIMNNKKAREIHLIARATYDPRWVKTKRMTFKNYYRKLKDEYVRGKYV